MPPKLLLLVGARPARRRKRDINIITTAKLCAPLEQLFWQLYERGGRNKHERTTRGRRPYQASQKLLYLCYVCVHEENAAAVPILMALPSEWEVLKYFPSQP